MNTAIFYEQYSTGNFAPGVTASSFNQRALNTQDVNGIAGCSLGTNVISLPAGTYNIAAEAKSSMYDTAQLCVWDYTNNVQLGMQGLSCHTLGGGPTSQGELTASVATQITLPNTANIGLSHYVGAVSVTSTPVPSLGAPCGSGLAENYAYIKIEGPL